MGGFEERPWLASSDIRKQPQLLYPMLVVGRWRRRREAENMLLAAAHRKASLARDGEGVFQCEGCLWALVGL